MAGLKKLAGQTAVYGLSSIIGRFLNYLLVPLYTYTFAPEQYGVVTEFYAYVVVLQIILTYGMETGFFRFSEMKYKADTVFSTILTSVISTSSLFIFIVIIFSHNISNAIGHANNNDYVIIFSLILALDSITAIFFAKLRRENKALKFATFKLINISINIFLNLFFLLVCPSLLKHNFNFISSIYNPNFGVGYIFVSNLIASLITFLLFFPDFFVIKFSFSRKLLNKILIYSLPLLVTGLTGAVNEMSDRIFIKYLTVPPLGTANPSDYAMYQLGIYGANAKIAVVMMMFVQAFRYAAEPFFFSTAKVLNNNTLKTFADVLKYYIFLSFLLFLIILVNLNFFKYFINKSYFTGLNVVFPLFLSRILVGVFFIFSFWYKLKDITKYGIYIFTTGAFITILFDVIFIPKFGYIAAAWTNFLTYSVMVLISYFWGRKYLKIDYQFKRIFSYVFISLFIYFLSKYINFNISFLNLIFRNGLILLYVFIFIKIEKINLKTIISNYGNKNNK